MISTAGGRYLKHDPNALLIGSLHRFSILIDCQGSESNVNIGASKPLTVIKLTLPPKT